MKKRYVSIIRDYDGNWHPDETLQTEAEARYSEQVNRIIGGRMSQKVRVMKSEIPFLRRHFTDEQVKEMFTECEIALDYDKYFSTLLTNKEDAK